MMDVLKGVVKAANTIMLLINGEETRLDSSLQQMLREMQALFGESFWKHTIIGVSHWPYDINSIMQRNHTGKTEEWFSEQWNTELNDKFQINLTLPAVFIDSYSQQPWNIEDPLQHEAFTRETSKLWDFSQSMDLFQFMSIEDVLEENQELKAEVKWLNDVITNNISEIFEKLSQHDNEIIHLGDDISYNAAFIVKNSAEIGENTAMISANADSIGTSAANIAQNTADIEVNSGKIDVNVASIGQNTNKITQNTNSIHSIETDVDDLQSNMVKMPLGTIVPWTPRPSSDTSHQSSIPDQWQACDGSAIKEGPWAGRKTPDLNLSKRFLRGGVER